MSLCGFPSAGSAPITNVSPGCGSRQITRPGYSRTRANLSTSISGIIAPTQPLSSKAPIQTAGRQGLEVRRRILLEEIVRCARAREYVTFLLLVPLHRPPRSGRPRQEDRPIPVLAPLARPVDPLEGALRLALVRRREQDQPAPRVDRRLHRRQQRIQVVGEVRLSSTTTSEAVYDRPPVVGNARPTDPFASSML